MPVGFSQALRLTRETVKGTYDTTQHGTANELWLRLESDNAFGVRRTQGVTPIRGAGGLNRRELALNPTFAVAGPLSCHVYPTQAATLIGWLLTLSGGDLTTFTADFFDGTRALSYLGCMFGATTLTASRQSQGLRMQAQVLGMKTAAPNANFAYPPAITAFPAENPYLFAELFGGVTWGTSRANFKTWSLSVGNKVVGGNNEQAGITSVSFAGRDVDMSCVLEYASTADRLSYETSPQAALAAAAVFTKASPMHALTFNMEATTFILSLSDELPIGDLIYQGVQIGSFYDRTAGTDITFTAT
ncbi:MAG TPA: hypothetical protein VG406_23465 [Isosphaeraceae bacterium]|jgi:hypothetical protein|nr:hypothetical protein [Isosphaeraceae bacterium]